MADTPSPDPPRRPLPERLQVYIDIFYKLLAAGAAAIAVWKGLQ